ncbi:MAG: hypothetical protein ACT4OZ_02490 [Gemmatimonadota bacterium]
MEATENLDNVELLNHDQAASIPVARLAVVLISGNPADEHDALDLLSPKCKALNADLVLVTSAQATDRLGAEWPEVIVRTVPPGTSDSAMRQEGLEAVGADIVTIRRIDDVGDATWLSAFHRVLGFEAPPRVQHEWAPDRRRRTGASTEYPIAGERRRENLVRAGIIPAPTETLTPPR